LSGVIIIINKTNFWNNGAYDKSTDISDITRADRGDLDSQGSGTHVCKIIPA
jgi:hypothetical protein